MSKKHLEYEPKEWTTVAELVGRNIEGRRAIITQPQHIEMFARNQEALKVRTLIKAERIKKADGTWLYIRWIPEGGDFGCGYSGWREDYTGIPVVLFEPGPFDVNPGGQFQP